MLLQRFKFCRDWSPSVCPARTGWSRPTGTGLSRSHDARSCAALGPTDRLRLFRNRSKLVNRHGGEVLKSRARRPCHLILQASRGLRWLASLSAEPELSGRNTALRPATEGKKPRIQLIVWSVGAGFLRTRLFEGCGVHRCAATGPDNRRTLPHRSSVGVAARLRPPVTSCPRICVCLVGTMRPDETSQTATRLDCIVPAESDRT